jgi:hypothetical protein
VYCFDYRADDMSDQTTTPAIVPANAALLRDVAEDYASGLACVGPPEKGGCSDCDATAARLRALASVLGNAVDKFAEVRREILDLHRYADGDFANTHPAMQDRIVRDIDDALAPFRRFLPPE